MARFKASRFAKTARVTKAPKPAAEPEDKAEPKPEAPAEPVAQPIAQMMTPMKTSPIVEEASPPSEHLARRVDPGVPYKPTPAPAPAEAPDAPPVVSPIVSAAVPPTVSRVDSAEGLSRRHAKVEEKPSGSDGGSKGSDLIDEKADSSSTSVADERPQGGVDDPGQGGQMGFGDPDGAVSQFTASDFGSRGESAGFGSFAGDGSSDEVAGADQIPTDGPGSSPSDDGGTLIRPGSQGMQGPSTPAGFDATPTNIKGGNLGGMAMDRDEQQSGSMASLSGISEGDGGASTPDSSESTTNSDDDTKASEYNTQTEDATGTREYLKDNSDGAGQTLDVDNMSDGELADAASTEAAYEQFYKPGREFLKGGSDRTGQTPDVDRMSNQEVQDEINKEAEYEFRGGSGSRPSYVDSDSDGEKSAQVAADGAALGANTTSAGGGDIDPNRYGMDVDEDLADTSILDVSDRTLESAGDFGSGSAGSAPPTADVDFGPDHVDENPGSGPTDDIGGIGLGRPDDTVNIDLGSDGEAVSPMAQTYSAMNPGTPLNPSAAVPPTVSRVDSPEGLRWQQAKVEEKPSGSDGGSKGSDLIDEKADSSSTSVADERPQGGVEDPGQAGQMGFGDPDGAVSQFTASDFGSRGESAGFGSFADDESPKEVAGADQIPTSGPGSSPSDDGGTLLDAGYRGDQAPPTPAGFDATPTNLESANIRGLAGDADEYGSNTAAGVGGLSGGSARDFTSSGGQGKESGGGGGSSSSGESGGSGQSSGAPANDDLGPAAPSPGDDGDTDTPSASDPLSQGDKDYLEASGATERLKEGGYNLDDMSKQDVQNALGNMADQDVAVEPGKAYLEGTGRGYDVDNMSDEEVAAALDNEAEYEQQGGDGSDATPPTPGYRDYDSDTGEASEQVTADANTLGASTISAGGGDIDPSRYGMDVDEDLADTSILDVSNRTLESAGDFGSGSVGSAPPTANVDFGPDHVDENPGSGPTDDIGGIGLGHDDGTVNIDLGSDGEGVFPMAQTFSVMADAADEVGFAIDPGDVVDDSPVDDPDDDPDGLSRITDIFN